MQTSNSPILSDAFLKEALRIVEHASKQEVPVRVMGALAYRIHSPEFEWLHKKLERLQGGQEFTDIDLMSYAVHRDRMESLFAGIGYLPEPRARKLPPIWAYRHMYVEPNGRFLVDLFFDKLEMSHTLDLRGRLELDYPTLPLVDLLMEKTQIVQVNEKDIKDAVVLIRAHSIGRGDREAIDADYLAKLLSNDWGFCHTVTRNLEKLKRFVSGYDAIPAADRSDILSKVDGLLARIVEEPKSVGFKMRAKIGEKKKWYNEVGETFRN